MIEDHKKGIDSTVSSIENEFEKKILEEIRNELQLSPTENCNLILSNYIKEGILDIDENNGIKTDYEKDLISKRLLRLYVIYAYYKRLAEFKNLYSGDYAERQRFYFQATYTNV